MWPVIICIASHTYGRQVMSLQCQSDINMGRGGVINSYHASIFCPIYQLSAFYVCCINYPKTTFDHECKHNDIRLLHREKSDLGPYCWQNRLL